METVARIDTLGCVDLPDGLGWAMAQPQNTRAVVAVYNGRIIGERYAPGFTKDTPQLSWSEGKSLTATLIGLLVQQALGGQQESRGADAALECGVLQERLL